MGYRLLRPTPTRGGLSSRELSTLREAALAVLRADVKEGPIERRSSALLGLGLSRDEALRPELEQALRQPEAPLRAQAAAALGELGIAGPSRRSAPSWTSQAPAAARVRRSQVAVAAALRQLGDPRGQRFFLEQMLDTRSKRPSSALLSSSAREGRRMPSARAA